MSDLTHLSALRAHWKRHKAFPSMAKLTEVLGMASTGGVFKALNRLVDAGYLERVDGRMAPTPKFFARPVMGTARAGLPQPQSQEDGFEVLSIDDYLVDHPERTSLCRVRGDSMKDAGLLEGDIVVVESNTLPRPGNVVVAVVDGQVTIKTLAQGAGGTWVLEPANPIYGPIVAEASLEVLGVVVGSFRKMR